MSSKIERQAADVTPGTPYARTTVTTHEVIAIPAADRGKFWAFQAVTSDVYIRFGTSSSVEVSASQRSTLTEGVLTADGKEAHLVVPAGGEKHRKLDPDWTHFAHESADTSGALFFGAAQGTGE